ncbi:glycoside hydrolase family 19 protein [Lentzea sp. BCCO 10_0061]|uniref:Glycoside hydrolase family 19 protein n=1 Tax=Lentzea sokolovensis TaxID=3095429 RepID=A0ABU4UXB8_9PSEU|nr:glycoside hydrolase family 19 protein [Lentzea sp. BCCO 10_0061]MDX8143330.1 glycoside hydrolase family 19 protein [Lentzea sp. BCCO 10_0061]
MSRKIAAALVGTAIATTLLAGVGATAAQAAEAGPRIGVLINGTLNIKEGNLFTSWVPQIGNVAKFEIDGSRVGVLTTGGEVLVKDGDLYAPWTTQLGGAKDFHLAGNRIGVLRNDNSLAVKDGDLYAGWTEQTGDVKDFDLTPNRVGVVFTGGLASVKEGDLYSSWVNQLSGAKDIELAGGRIGVLRGDNTLAVKDGTLYESWTEQTGDVADFEMTPTRIGVVSGNGTATVKEGNLYAGWVNQLGGAKAIELAGDRLGVLRADNSFAVKEGSLYASWTEQASPVSQADLTAPASAPGQVVTLQDLRNIYGAISNEATVQQGLESLNAEMIRGGITTPARKAAFLATLRNESGFRYNAVEGGVSATYKGRGYMQLTSEANYRGAGAHLGVDLLGNPEAAASLQYSASIARWYWTVARSDSNNAADHYDMGLISRYVGYAASSAEDAERCTDFKSALRYFNGGSLPVAEGAITCYRH